MSDTRVTENDAIVYATDIHLTDRQPVNRVAPVSLGLTVFKNLLALAEERKAALVLGGDLFDTPNPSYDLLSQVIFILTSYKEVPVYMCRGNHDVNYANMDKACGISVLEQTGLITFLENGLFVNGFYISAYDYEPRLPYVRSADNKKWNLEVLPEPPAEVMTDVTTVMVAHLPIVTQHVPYDHIYAYDIKTDADYVLCGHIHERFSTVINSTSPSGDGKAYLINPGCLFRLKRNEKDIEPSALLIERIGGKAVHSFIPVPGDPDPQFILEDPKDTVTFNAAVEDAKIEVSDVEAYIHASSYPKVVQDKAIELIKEKEGLND